MTKLKLSAITVDICSAAAFTSCLGICLLSPTIFAYDAPLFIIISSVSVLLSALIGKRWWLIPPAAAVAAIILAATRQLMPLWESFISYASWLLNSPDINTAQGFEGWLTVTRAFILFAIAAASYLLISKLGSVTLTLAACAAAISFYTIMIPGVNLALVITLSAISVIILFPRLYSRHVAMKREFLQIVALPAAALCVLLMLILPGDTSSWRSRTLSNLADDIGMLFDGPFTTWPEHGSSFSLSSLGFGVKSGRLGGPVTLKERQYLTVMAEHPAYLRGSVLDYYDGSNWLISRPDGNLRYQSLIWRGYRREVFGQNKPVGSREAADLYNELTIRNSMTVWYRQKNFYSLFSPLGITSISLRDNSAEAYFNIRSELFIRERNDLSTRPFYTSRSWNRQIPGFSTKFALLEQLCASSEDPGWQDVVSRYLQLPENLPDELFSISSDIISDCESEYEKAEAIERWIGELCKYTLEPSEVPEDREFVSYFLETKEGYCVYTATAMTVLARCAGLPSRYVQGFSLQKTGTREYIATGRTAHAWCEVYFKGIGWVEFDPLYWNVEEPLNDEAVIAPAPVPTPTPSVSVSVSISPSPEPEEVEAIDLSELARLAVIVIFSCLAVAFIFVAIYHALLTRRGRKFRLERIQKRVETPEEQLLQYFKDNIFALSLLNIPKQPEETLITYSARVDNQVKLSKTFSELCGYISNVIYAGSTPEQEWILAASEYHKLLESELRSKLGVWVYIAKTLGH